MMRSLYSGVSGLKTHQTKMDVIGNNIANVNTTAYKSSSITFNALMSQTTKKASGPNALTGVGGTNARQIGLGVKAGAINTNISGQGSSQSTGNPFDIMITGDAFFVVNNGSSNFFTRDGSFYVDGGGNLAMTSTGYNVMGWQVDPDDPGSIKQDTVTALRIMNQANMTYPPEATTQANISGVIDSNDKNVTSPSGKSINLSFYDALGYSYTAKLVMKQSDNPHEFSFELDRILDSTGKEIRDLEGKTLPVKDLVKFGEVERSQAKKTVIGMDTAAYKWDGNRLQTATDPAVTLADLSNMFNADGTLKDLTAENVPAAGDTPAITVGQALDNIAKAHGYEGSTDEFMQLAMKRETVTGTGDTAETTITYVPMAQLLYNATQAAQDGVPAFPKLTSTNSSATMDGRVFDGALINYDADTGVFAGINGVPTSNTVTLNFSALGGNFSDITVDFSQSSNYDKKGTSTIGAEKGALDANGSGAGRRLGEMIGLTVQDNGMIYATYDSGMTRLLGQIATALFANASGLEKNGDNLYSATLNSGEFDGIGVDITADGGYMTTGQLEMSNVDLSSEFTEMITTQRGFQANSRIITVSDTLLEELTNLKR